MYATNIAIEVNRIVALSKFFMQLVRAIRSRSRGKLY